MPFVRSNVDELNSCGVMIRSHISSTISDTTSAYQAAVQTSAVNFGHDNF